MHKTVAAILPGSAASKSIIKPGDVLRKINGNTITDVLDYQYYSYDSRLLIELTGAGGSIKLVSIRKKAGSGPGLEFESELMDTQRGCGNKCIFCFIDQLPEGMRGTLYFKDDDVRLSFLHGNYVTLTNLSNSDIERIIKLHISPLNISVHTLDPQLQQFMLGINNTNRRFNIKKILEKLTEAGITLNCQIICCPGINDKNQLRRTIRELIKLGPGINSVSVVPVGLTRYREGLYPLQPFNRELAGQTVRMVEHYGKQCRKKRGTGVFYCADELYIMAGMKLPQDGFYDNYPQLENGTGMMRLFITEFMDALKNSGRKDCREHNENRKCDKPGSESEDGFITIITGELAAPYLVRLMRVAGKKHEKFGKCRIQAVKNRFFGRSVTVSGLVTGADIISQLKGRKHGRRLLLPRNMLRYDDAVFLDDITLGELSNTLGVPVDAVETNGKEFFDTLMRYLYA